MKNNEHVAINLIGMIFRNKKFLPILIVILACYVFGFKTSGSQLTCNNSVCKVQEKNSFGMVLVEKSVSLANVESFSYKNDYDWYYLLTHLNSKYSSTERRAGAANRYSIVVKEKTGKEYRLVDKTFTIKSKVSFVVDKLNTLLEQENINTTLKF